MNNSMSKTLLKTMAAGGAVLWMCTGCISTMGTSAASAEASRQEDFALMNERLRRMEGDVESLRLQIDQLQDDVRRTRTDAADAANAQAAGLQANLAALESRLQHLEATRESDRQEIIDTVSRKVTDLINAQPAPSGGGAAGVYGREHIVQAGETLSRIAQAYGSTVGAILKANNLQNADSLQIGQRLIIPD